MLLFMLCYHCCYHLCLFEVMARVCRAFGGSREGGDSTRGILDKGDQLQVGALHVSLILRRGVNT